MCVFQRDRYIACLIPGWNTVGVLKLKMYDVCVCVCDILYEEYISFPFFYLFIVYLSKNACCDVCFVK